MNVHVYVDPGTPNAHVVVAARATQLPRPDVPVVVPGAEPDAGYAVTVPLEGNGLHLVCAYGINVTGTPGSNATLGCSFAQ